MGLKIKKCLGYAWASPMTIFGAVYAHTFALLGWYRWHGVVDDALVWKLDYEVSPDFLKKYWYFWEGQTIGNVVVMRHNPEDRPSIMQHELKHVDQCMRLGIFLPLLYVLNLLAIKIGCKGSDPYYSNPFEIDARRHAGQSIDVEGSMKKLLNRSKKD